MKRFVPRLTLLLLATGLAGVVTYTGLRQPSAVFAAMHGSHPHDAHMVMTKLAPAQPGDEARSATVLAGAKKAAERFSNYRDAQDDGYTIFLPEQKQDVYHFVRFGAGSNGGPFNPDKPPALLYTKNAGKGYTFVGVMYVAPPGATEQDLNSLVPLSVAHWHKHVNLCAPAHPDEDGNWLMTDPRFGLKGSITTAKACEAAGGQFHPDLAGWMTHVYPLESDPAKIWASGMEDMHGKSQDDSMADMPM
jgi:hypothetical protein